MLMMKNYYEKIPAYFCIKNISIIVWTFTKNQIYQLYQKQSARPSPIGEAGLFYEKKMSEKPENQIIFGIVKYTFYLRNLFGKLQKINILWKRKTDYPICSPSSLRFAGFSGHIFTTM